ncbi:MAG: DUF2062 domain-containing protein [Candidatus Competibacterales bacterium]
MFKRFLQRHLPDHHSIRRHGSFRFLGPLLHDPNLWHLNRRSVSGALGVGLFNAFIPVPFQSLLAAICAVWLRVNLPLAIAAVWVTNPLTIPPMFYFTYKVGTWILGTPPQPFAFELSMEWLLNRTGQILPPLLLGSLLVGSLLGTAAFIAVRHLWRHHVLRRRARRRQTQRQTPSEAAETRRSTAKPDPSAPPDRGRG